MLLRAASRIPAAARRLCRDRSGVAMIEFAYSLPLLTVIGMAGVETANFVITVLKINKIAMMAADNAARVRTSIDESDVNEVLTGVWYAGQEIKFGERGRVFLSSLEANGQAGANAGYKVGWQRCFGAKDVQSAYGAEGDGATNSTMATGMGPAGNKITPVANSALVFAEVRYRYVPVLAPGYMVPQELSAVQAFSVRERAAQALTNTNNLTDAQKRLCDNAHLSST